MARYVSEIATNCSTSSLEQVGAMSRDNCGELVHFTKWGEPPSRGENGEKILDMS